MLFWCSVFNDGCIRIMLVDSIGLPVYRFNAIVLDLILPYLLDTVASIDSIYFVRNMKDVIASLSQRAKDVCLSHMLLCVTRNFRSTQYPLPARPFLYSRFSNCTFISFVHFMHSTVTFNICASVFVF